MTVITEQRQRPQLHASRLCGYVENPKTGDRHWTVWRHTGDACPACGAPITTTVCDYCRTSHLTHYVERRR